jgi:hypothetical protein
MCIPPITKIYMRSLLCEGGLTVCVIRMYLLGTWQTRILKVTRSPGTRLGCGRLGSPAAAMGQLIVHKSEPAALFGHPADTNLGLASDAKNPYR